MSIFSNLFENEHEKYITGLTLELQALYVYNRFNKNNESITLVTSSLYEANKLYKTISNYTNDVLLFPMDDFLTSEALAISPELKITRLETLCNINDKPKIIVTNLMGFLRYLPKKNIYNENIVSLKVSDNVEIDVLIKKLDLLGYERQTIVEKTGDIAIRGFVVDIFPLSSTRPLRIEFWGDEIESIRYFDENTQKSLETIDEVIIYPYTESLFKTDDLNKKHHDIKNYIEIENISDFSASSLYFYNYNDIKNEYINIQNEILEYNASKNLNLKYMFDLEEYQNKIELYIDNFDNNSLCVEDTKKYISGNIEKIDNIEQINNVFTGFLKKGKTVVVCFDNKIEQLKILDIVDEKKVIVTNEEEIFENNINFIVKKISHGFIFKNYIFISSNELFNKKESYVYKSNFRYGSKIRDINKLEIGDYVVHFIHGIGKYLGLKTIEQNKISKDYLTIEYKGGDKLYIPVEKIDYISKYSSNETISPKINKLGSSEWAKTKLKVRKKLENIAGELIKLSALRKMAKGIKFDKDSQEQLDFEKDFEFTETLDQIRVTDEIKCDMESECPMDRLVCGDVGYGKTEVAFRAIAKAILSGKQVAYLCPTTILSNQHYKNALDRFRNLPINIEILNRFQTPKKTKEIIQGIKEGKVDLVFGTHRILSEDVVFKDIGLLVIDEEQRFGVKHKEKIKQFKNNIDVLTLSATPIPRTLQMSMTGLRSLSLLETPPVNRYPVQTYVLEENNAVLKDGIYKELSRGGQVFILYNSVIDMDKKINEISKLIPDAKITYAHGKMTKTELEDIMYKFINKEYDIMICTTIIETGIDIPNVNTLFIFDADRFGLSQLYQIRGRVGRSDKIAYCYLMYHPGKILSDVAIKRLEVIKEFTELGSGFSIAMRDLSIRGAGDILGSEQAGFVDSVGIELYLSMLNEEINKLKGLPVKSDVDIEEHPLISVKTTISDDYVDNTELKIEIHKKINEIDSYDKLNNVKLELEDRFGKIPDELIIYMYQELFEKMARDLNITKIRQTSNFIEVVVPKDLTNILDVSNLFYDVSMLSNMFRFSMKFDCLIITLDIIKLDKHFVYYLIDLLKLINKNKR